METNTMGAALFSLTVIMAIAAIETAAVPIWAVLTARYAISG